MIRPLRLVVPVAGLLLVLGSALTTANVVGSSRAGQNAQRVTAVQLAPPECAALALTSVRSIIGTRANDLVLGTPANNTVRGRQGNDCVLGGAGNDRVRGDGGFDVCIGGPGNDVFTNCETQYQ